MARQTHPETDRTPAAAAQASDGPERPQIYLITPPDPSPEDFPSLLAAVFDAGPVACLRLRAASLDEARIARNADLLREIAHERDIPLVIDSHVQLVTRLGLDGVHLPEGARAVRAARRTLGADAIIGAHCGISRHEGMNAGEAGADYVSFGPVGITHLGSGARADPELFAWWSEMIELPVVAEGALDPASIAALAPAADFFGFGDEIWSSDDPALAFRALAAAIG